MEKLNGEQFKLMTIREINHNPAILLVNPQMGENVGMAARAMLNFGIDELRLVAPRDGWPSIKANQSSAGALDIIRSKNIKVFDDYHAACADFSTIYITSARKRDLSSKIYTPRQIATQLRLDSTLGLKSCIVFGPESSGLLNEHASVSDGIIKIPSNPRFNSLNLAMSVLLICYEWHLSGLEETQISTEKFSETKKPANKSELNNFLKRLYNLLLKNKFLYPPEKIKIMSQNINAIFSRNRLTSQEISTLHGIITSLSKPNKYDDKNN